MAIDKVIQEIGSKVLKEGLNKSIESLKGGSSFSEALKSGGLTVKEEALKELNNFLSPEAQNKFQEASESLDKVQENLEFSPETIQESEVVSEVNTSIDNINSIAVEFKEENFSLFQEMKAGLDEFKDLLIQLKEVKAELGELGINSDLFSKLNVDVHDIEEMEDEGEE